MLFADRNEKFTGKVFISITVSTSSSDSVCKNLEVSKGDIPTWWPYPAPTRPSLASGCDSVPWYLSQI